jgi:hypothetical protein
MRKLPNGTIVPNRTLQQQRQKRQEKQQCAWIVHHAEECGSCLHVLCSFSFLQVQWAEGIFCCAEVLFKSALKESKPFTLFLAVQVTW